MTVVVGQIEALGWRGFTWASVDEAELPRLRRGSVMRFVVDLATGQPRLGAVEVANADREGVTVTGSIHALVPAISVADLVVIDVDLDWSPYP